MSKIADRNMSKTADRNMSKIADHNMSKIADRNMTPAEGILQDGITTLSTIRVVIVTQTGEETSSGRVVLHPWRRW